MRLSDARMPRVRASPGVDPNYKNAQEREQRNVSRCGK
jgi:hypothetical protein